MVRGWRAIQYYYRNGERQFYKDGKVTITEQNQIWWCSSIKLEACPHLVQILICIKVQPDGAHYNARRFCPHIQKTIRIDEHAYQSQAKCMGR